MRNFVLRTIYLRNKAGTKTKNIAKINTILSNKIRLIDDDDDLFIATCDVIAYITCRYQFLDSFRSGKINAEAYAKMRDRARSAQLCMSHHSKYKSTAEHRPKEHNEWH